MKNWGIWVVSLLLLLALQSISGLEDSTSTKLDLHRIVSDPSALYLDVDASILSSKSSLLQSRIIELGASQSIEILKIRSIDPTWRDFHEGELSQIKIIIRNDKNIYELHALDLRNDEIIFVPKQIGLHVLEMSHAAKDLHHTEAFDVIPAKSDVDRVDKTSTHEIQSGILTDRQQYTIGQSVRLKNLESVFVMTWPRKNVSYSNNTSAQGEFYYEVRFKNSTYIIMIESGSEPIFVPKDQGTYDVALMFGQQNEPIPLARENISANDTTSFGIYLSSNFSVINLSTGEADAGVVGNPDDADQQLGHGSSGLMQSGHAAQIVDSNILIKTDHEHYLVGEMVTVEFSISLPPQSNITNISEYKTEHPKYTHFESFEGFEFNLIAGQQNYRFLGSERNRFVFYPKFAGNLKLQAIKDGIIYAQKSVNVTNTSELQPISNATPGRNYTYLGRDVKTGQVATSVNPGSQSPTKQQVHNFEVGQGIYFIFDFSDKIQRKNILDKLFRITSIESLTAYIQGQEANSEVQIAIVPLGHNRFLANVSSIPSTPGNVHELVVNATYDNGQMFVSERRYFSVGHGRNTIQQDVLAASKDKVERLEKIKARFQNQGAEPDDLIVKRHVTARFDKEHTIILTADFSNETSDRRSVLNNIFRKSTIEKLSIFMANDPDQNFFQVTPTHKGNDVFEIRLGPKSQEAYGRLHKVVVIANYGEKLSRRDFIIDLGARPEVAISQLEDFGLIGTRTRLDPGLKSELKDNDVVVVTPEGDGVKSRARLAFDHDSAGNIEIDLYHPKIHKVRLRNSSLSSTQILGLDYFAEVASSHQLNAMVPAPSGERWEKIYAIDQEGTDADSISLWVTAQGRNLFRCSEWNFVERRCDGSWDKARDLVVGQSYDIQLMGKNDAYAESGLIAVNTNKSIYLPGQKAFIAIGLLDSNGRMVCDANMTLQITEPDGRIRVYTTTQGQIKISPECSVYGYTSLPDYYSEHEVHQIGRYKMNVTAVWDNGEAIRISEFEVRERVDFDIARLSATRIFPYLPYNMTISIIANEQYVGDVKDYVPSSFEVLPQSGMVVSDAGKGMLVGQKEITWKMQLEPQGYYQLSYIYDAPDISPYFYTIGPLQIGSFVESRRWEIASDVKQLDSEAMSAPTANQTIQRTSTFTITCTPSCSGSGAHPTVTHTYQWCNSSDCGHGANTISTSSATTEALSVASNPDSATCNQGVSNTITARNIGTVFIRCKGDDGTNTQFSSPTYMVNVTGDNSPSLSSQQSPNPDKNDSSIFENDTVGFNATWEDDYGLRGFRFEWNITGAFRNVSYGNFTGLINVSNSTQRVNLSAGNVVGWRFYANDSSNQTTGTSLQTFTVASASDAQAPTITAVKASPNVTLSKGIVNISATITDNFGVSNAYAEIMYPDGTKENNSMTSISSMFYYLFTTKIGGNYSVVIYAIDGNSNHNNTQDNAKYFNVTANITTERFYYGAGEIVTITGIGYSASHNATLVIRDSSNATVSGFPSNKSTNSSGEFVTTWTVPTESTQVKSGNHTLNASDARLSWLVNTTKIRVVLKPFYALKDDNGGTQDVLDRVNHSDGTTSTIQSAVNREDYVMMNWSNTYTSSYKINKADIFIEHNAPATNTMYITWFNGTGYSTVCSFTTDTTNRITNCTISGINTIQKANSISLKYTDNNLIGNNEQFKIDFAYMIINYSLDTDMHVIINEPSYSRNIRNYTDSTNSKAYFGGESTRPPTSITSGTELSSAQYQALQSSDATKFSSYNDTLGAVAYHSFNFRIPETNLTISEFRVIYEGFATKGTGAQEKPVGYSVYLWNFSAGIYSRIQNVSGSSLGTDVVFNQSFSNFTHYLNASGDVWLLVESINASSSGVGEGKSNLTTDYVALEIAMHPPMTANETINFSALDADTISNCGYRFRNSSNTYSYVFMSSSAGNFWSNISDTTAYADGAYNLDANCTDSLGNFNSTESIYVKIDNTDPTVTLSSPNDNVNYSTTSAAIAWASSDSTSGNLLCSPIINSASNTSNPLVQVNGATKTHTFTGLSDGAYTWLVNCTDLAQRTTSSSSRTFRIDTTGPTVTPNSPSAGYSSVSSTITFNYTPSDATTGISNCSLIINNQTNLTNYTVTNNAANIFVQGGFSGTNFWQVNCTDFVGNRGSSSERNFTVDAGAPSVTLNYPSNVNFTNGSVQFNFTASDDSDPSMACNLSINGTVNNTGAISAANNANTLYSVTGINDADYYWNVSCADDAGGIGYSSRANFSVDRPPIITLNSPSDLLATPTRNVTFNYTPSDTYSVTSCTLYVDGTSNTTSSSISNNIANLINLTSNFTEGPHYWLVGCQDNRGSSANSSARNLTVDATKMSINTSAPANNSLLTTSVVTFNFTAIDNLDSTLDCSITINSIVESTGISATSGVLKSTTVSSMTNGVKLWNITCSDDAGNTNTSETKQFNVSSPTLVNLTGPAHHYYSASSSILLYYTANSTNAITNCSLFINKVYNQTNTTRLNTTGGTNNFTLGGLSQNPYNWSVNCLDDSNLTGSSDTRLFYIDLESANITLSYPQNATSYNLTSFGFNFTAIDSISANFSCNITLDGSKNNSASIFAANAVQTEYNISGFVEGYHTWNISCSDLAGISNTSTTFNFNVKRPPTISLQSPATGLITQADSLNFSYIPYDAFGVINCSLYLNDILNATNSTVITNSTNYFNVTGVNEGSFNWTVRCVDLDVNTGNSTTRTFTVDRTQPFIQLNSPSPGASFTEGSDVTFNWTALDNLDSTLSCNLTIDGVVNSSAIASSHNQSTTTTVSGLNSSTHTWNITCIDDALNSNISATRNFTLREVPEVILDSPLTGSGFADPNVTLSYQIFSSTAISNCSLIVNSAINQTNTSTVQLGGPLNLFNLTSLAEDQYSWTVNCTNVFGITGTATTEYFHIDNRSPSLNLSSPENNSVNYLPYLDFAFITSDNVDTNLSCNLTIDTLVNLSNFAATSGANTTKRVHNFTQGYHNWSVTCWDNPIFINTSEQRTFFQNFSPSLTLDYPSDGFFTALTSISFNFTPQDNEPTLLECRLNIDALQNGSTFNTPTSGTQLSRTVLGFNEGVHNWTANCTDNSLNPAVKPERLFYVDLSSPNISLVSPNGTSYSVSYVPFNFTSVDNLASNLTCNISVNNSVRLSGISTASGASYNTTLSNFTDGTHFWNVTCSDTVSLANTSARMNFSVQEKPLVSLGNPANSTRIKQTNYNFSITPTDNSYAIANCSLILNGLANGTSSSITHAASNLLTGNDLTHNDYNWTANCSDQSGNIGTNNSAKKFYVDLLGPGFNLITPSQGETFNQDDIYFNFTVYEQFGLNTTITCNLTLDLQVNVSSITLTDGGTNSTFIMDLTQGNHNWSVTCKDDLNNTNTSATLAFIVNAPDLLVTTGNITFNNTNPSQNDSIQINATIFNLGGIPANNFAVYFYDNMGTITYVNVGSLGVGANLSVNASWNITTGMHEILVNISYSGVELNSTNNNATNNLTILLPSVSDPINNSWFRQSTNNITILVRDYKSSSLNYTIYFDGAPNSSYSTTDGTSNIYISNLSQGKHDVVIEAVGPRVDFQGITQGLYRRKNSTDFRINIDLTNATINFETTNGSWYASYSPSISFNLTDNLASQINYTLYQNSSPYVSNTTNNATSVSVILSTPTEGPYDIVIEATDLAGNKRNSSALRINVDTTAPIPNITTANNTNTSDNTPQIQFNITDNLSPNVTYKFYTDFITLNVNGSAAVSQLSFANLSTLTDAYHNITLEATDLAGNKRNSSWITIFVDTTPPTIMIQNPTDDNPFGYMIDILTSIVDAGVGISSASYTVINDSGSLFSSGSLNSSSGYDAIWNSSANITESAEYVMVTINVTANDTLGNANNKSVRFIVDNKRPAINFFIPSGNDFRQSFSLDIRVQNRNITVSTYNITNSTYELKANNSNLSIGSAAFNWTDTISVVEASYPEGTYNITVFAVDSVGNNRTSANYFRIDRTAPQITLNAPVQFYNTSSSSVMFNFTVTDSFDTTMNCNLTVGGSIQSAGISAPNSTPVNITASGLAEGSKMWNVTCEDNAGNSNTSETRNLTIDLTAPTILLGNPANQSSQNSGSVVFYYTPNDNLLQIANCSLIINSSANLTNSTISKGSQNNFTLSLAEGSYSWKVNCTDSVGNIGTNASHRVFSVDLTAPSPNITTANNSWHSSLSPNLSFIITDNLDNNLSYTFYVNGSANVTGTASSGITTSATIAGLEEKDYRIVLGATDDATNTANSSFINIFIDVTSPGVQLLGPANNSNVSTTNVTFNFTVSDNRASTLSCNLTLDGIVNISSIMSTSGLNTSRFIVNLTSGVHNWSVSCIDNASNLGSNNTYYFNVTPPDLAITTGNITFNESSPRENKPFIIYANVYNIGRGEALNARVGFYSGDPEAGATQIGQNQSLNLQPSENKTVNVSAMLDIGDFSIFVILDQGNQISEELETNNKANKTGNIGAYQIVYGNLSGSLILSLNSSRVFSWDFSNASQGSIFAVDSDSSVTWSSLKALGKNSSSGNSSNDFTELDSGMNMGNLSDSINLSFTSLGLPRNVTNMTIFGKIVVDVPIINSTNSSNFLTGIAWDSSDNANGEFNGTQDVVFIAPINKNKVGRYGSYDFEIKIPARLRQYTQPNSESSVDIYVELK